MITLSDSQNEMRLRQVPLKENRIQIQAILGYKKVCSDCKNSLPVNMFYGRNRGVGSLYEYCKRCSKLRSKNWRKNNPNSARNSDLKKKYGITLEEKLSMFESQGRVCAACGSLDSRAKYPGDSGWHVDHNHSTNKVRSVLCGDCNLILGMVKDSPERLKALIKYLETF